MSSSDGDALHIAVGVISDDRGHFLISQRRADTHGAGEWEFPGGKVDPGETVYQALCRELDEELGVHVRSARPLIRIRHAYTRRTVVLDTWRVTDYTGTPVSREGQRLQWSPPATLRDCGLMAADGPIVNALALPDHYLLTGVFVDERDFLSRLDIAIARGVRLIRMRAPLLEDARYHALARAVVARCREAGVTCLLDRDADMVRELDAHGLHLPAWQLDRCERRPVDPTRWFAVSCHNATELARAAALNADFAVLSPVKPTPTHPGVDVLGWLAFNDLVANANFPVFALGGLQREDLTQAWRHGAQGIAAIRGLWD